MERKLRDLDILDALPSRKVRDTDIQAKKKRIRRAVTLETLEGEIVATSTTCNGTKLYLSFEDGNLFYRHSWVLNGSTGHFKCFFKRKGYMLHRVIAQRLGLDLSNEIKVHNGNFYDCRRCNVYQGNKIAGLKTKNKIINLYPEHEFEKIEEKAQ